MIAQLGHWLYDGGRLVLVLVAIRAAIAVFRFARLPAAAKRNYPAALWARFRWRWLTRNLNLSYVDRHRKAVKPVPFGTSVKISRAAADSAKLRFPRARIRADAFGLVASVKTVPGVGRAEFDKNAAYISDAWKCVRTQVTQPKPGRIIIRGLRSDPLLVPLSASEVTNSESVTATEHRSKGVSAGVTKRVSVTPHRLYIGRDEWGQDRYFRLGRNVTGITIGGLPGYGKTSLVNSWLCQLAGSPAVQFVIIDGKGAGDYSEWEQRAWIYAGDELPAAAAALEDAHALMRRQFSAVLELTGHRNGWAAGPSPEFPLIVVVIDECHTFFDLDAVKADRQAEALVRACRSLTGQLVRKGGSVCFLTIVMTQKQTGDAIPTMIRDNSALGLSFAVKTKDAAVASLGDHIREHPSFCPTGLQDPAYVGVATTSLKTHLDPFVRVRVPEITEDAAAARAAATASLRSDPRSIQLADADAPALALP